MLNQTSLSLTNPLDLALAGLSKRSRRRLRRECLDRRFAVNTADYGPITSDSSRGPSATIWRDCPITLIQEQAMEGAGGMHIWDDFLLAPEPSAGAAIASYGSWASWGAAGTTITDAIEEGGVLKINGTTANKSFILTSDTGCFRFMGPTSAFVYSGGKFWAEWRIALGSIAASQQGVFLGVADQTSSQINSSDTTIVASGGNTLTTTKNLFGFFNRTTTSPADFSFVYQPASGTAVYPTGLTTVVNDVTGSNIAAYAASTIKGQGTGFVKIGMIFDPTPANPSIFAPSSPPSGQTAGLLYKPLIRIFVNGVQHAKFLAPANTQATTFPVNAIFSPVFNYMNIVGATAPVYMDWMRFAQLPSF